MQNQTILDSGLDANQATPYLITNLQTLEQNQNFLNRNHDLLDINHSFLLQNAPVNSQSQQSMDDSASSVTGLVNQSIHKKTKKCMCKKNGRTNRGSMCDFSLDSRGYLRYFSVDSE